MKLFNKNGFGVTNIPMLLIAIVIMGIIFVAIIPGIGNAFDKLKKASCSGGMFCFSEDDKYVDNTGTEEGKKESAILRGAKTLSDDWSNPNELILRRAISVNRIEICMDLMDVMKPDYFNSVNFIKSFLEDMGKKKLIENNYILYQEYEDYLVIHNYKDAPTTNIDSFSLCVLADDDYKIYSSSNNKMEGLSEGKIKLSGTDLSLTFPSVKNNNVISLKNNGEGMELEVELLLEGAGEVASFPIILIGKDDEDPKKLVEAKRFPFFKSYFIERQNYLSLNYLYATKINLLSEKIKLNGENDDGENKFRVGENAEFTVMYHSGFSSLIFVSEILENNFALSNFQNLETGEKNYIKQIGDSKLLYVTVKEKGEIDNLIFDTPYVQVELVYDPNKIEVG